MSQAARDLLDTVRNELALEKYENRLVPLIESGKAPMSVLSQLAGEQYSILRSDWRSFLLLAARAPEPTAGGFFTALAQGEVLALEKLYNFAEACGLDRTALAEYKPLPGCQAYSAYVAWLALNGDSCSVVLAVLANFAAWGNYCRAVAQGLRENYGFSDTGCGFFDFFSTPVPELEEQALAVIQLAIDTGRNTDQAYEYGRILQSYELMFWNTLVDQVPQPRAPMLAKSTALSVE